MSFARTNVLGPSIQVDKSALKSVDRRLGPVARTHFIEQRADMNSHCLLSDMKILGDLAVTKSSRNPDEHLALAWC